MESKIKEIMANLFEISVDQIDNLSSPDTIEKWDSLNHLNLVVILEEEFNITLTEEQIGEMLNYSLVVEIVKEHLQN